MIQPSLETESTERSARRSPSYRARETSTVSWPNWTSYRSELSKLLSVATPPPRQTVSEWADANRRLSPEASAEPGQWDTSRAEYLRGIMDAVSDPAVHTTVVMAAAQTGKTETLNNLVGFHIDRDPSPILVLQPTLDMGQAWSKDRLAPMLRDTPSLRGKVKDARSRDSANTVLHKVFPGGHITIAGANSAASLASRPIRIVVADEIDRYPASAGTEGDPVSLASKRSMTFWNRKLVLTSTPTMKGASRIEKAWEKSDQRRFYVPCPLCQHSQTMKWSSVRWDKDAEGESMPETAAYYCEGCGAAWSEAERLQAVTGGEWRASRPPNGTAGFHLNALVSPWVQLPELVAEFLDSKDFPEKLRVFVNTCLGESWEDQAGEKVDPTGFLERCESWGEHVPEGAAVLTVGVDVQDDRLELEVVGWGAGEEAWSLDYRVIRGDPSTAAPWNDLDAILLKSYRRADGVDLRITATAVDAGGHHAQGVYSFTRARYARRVWAVRGASKPGQPIWPRKPTKKNVGRVPLFMVGTDAAKDLIMGRLRIEPGRPGYCHFPADRDAAYFAQLTAERVVTKYDKGHPKRTWVKKPSQRNEALDARVYATAALAGLVSMGLEIEREVERLAALAHAIRVQAPTPQYAPRRRVRSAGITI